MATKATTATANTTTTERLLRIVTGALMLSPAVLLGIFGWAHFSDGLARDAAIPVPVYMVAEIALPKAAYASAAAALARADHRDGQATIAQAEARQRSGEQATQVVPLLVAGLSRQPASPRGWTLLSEVLFPSHKVSAARALSQALVLAPREYWLVGRRAKDASAMWPWLDADSREQAVAQTRLLWTHPPLREQLKILLQSPDGAQTTTRAFGEDDIRSINRWYSRESWRSPQP